MIYYSFVLLTKHEMNRLFGYKFSRAMNANEIDGNGKEVSKHEEERFKIAQQSAPGSKCLLVIYVNV
jgi:hypothetical protein